MKAESGPVARRRGRLSTAEAEDIALRALHGLIADGDRLGRFLTLSGLDPGSIRQAAGEPGFLPAVLDHVMADEELLLALAREIGEPPERLAEARHLLSPEPDWSA